MFKNFDYCDSNYPFKYDKNYDVYQILKNTKRLCKSTEKYTDYTKTYTNMTIKKSYKITTSRNDFYNKTML